jgi:glyoxylase-like metal-dependent hydrolase (beta-lactamase superfamily II)
MELSVLIAGSGFPKLRASVTLLREGGRATLVDSGLVDDAPRLVAALEARGLRPEDVLCVVATHLHHDHCGNHLLFPRARFVVSAVELANTRGFMDAYHGDRSPGKSDTAAILRSRNQAVKEYYVRGIVREVSRNLGFYERVRLGDPRFSPVEGRSFLTPGIELLPTPGHTAGHLSVVAHGARVEGHDGDLRDVLIAGDALLTRRSLLPGGDLDVHLAEDIEGFRRTRHTLLQAYRHFIPGHDALVEGAPPASRPAPEPARAQVPA